jgi:hypothetical protein
VPWLHRRVAGTARGGQRRFAVDDAVIDQPGVCKIESWFSAAANGDHIGTVSPSCTVSLGRPVEFNPQFQHARSSGHWSTQIAFLVKTGIFPVETGKLGLAVKGGPLFDLRTGSNTGGVAALLATYPLSEQFRLNVNGGWQYEGETDWHRLTWGLGFDWKFTGTFPLTLIGEVFGQAGRRDPAQPSVTDPRTQIGLRYTPIDTVDVDVIYGRNITGENANWITVGLNVRFNAFGERTAEAPAVRRPLIRK